MLYIFPFFEIKDAQGLIKSDFGLNKKSKIFYSIKHRLGGAQPPESLSLGDFLESLHIFITKRNKKSWVVPKFAKWSIFYLYLIHS